MKPRRSAQGHYSSLDRLTHHRGHLTTVIDLCVAYRTPNASAETIRDVLQLLRVRKGYEY